ncbi:DEAD/DEAH box helicase [Terrihabitans sp. B22-R8]|uniref:DEAD/DEAH box helicase n=1 Tax=Terrihabitans sp. B22-R8 TaxID=3425128 RepID=UPI00403C69AC
MSFESLGLSPKVLAAVAATGYTEPTPIQAQAIPEVLARRDVLGIAQTGTGKTASFTLPMLTRLEQGRPRARMPRTLILEPTRELAAQVEESFNRYGTNHKLSVALLIGGLSFGDQDAKLTRGVDVLIATPGRLLDHFERGRLLMTGIEILVIDEADRMLDMGFIPDIERICKLIPPKRQTLFFSATMPTEIQRLVDQFLRDPVKIEVAKPSTTSATITQNLIATSSEASEKRKTLRNSIRSEAAFKNAIVFCNRKRDISVLHRSLQKHGFKAVALHGDMDQRARMQALDQFKSGEAELLVASDVAARGLDIPAVSHVFNYDVPIHAEDYVHRIGRTGRAGLKGTAMTLVAPSDRRYLAAIEKSTAQDIQWVGEPLADDAVDEAPARSRGGRKDRGGKSAKSDKPEKAPRKREDRDEPKRPKDDERAARRPSPSEAEARPPRPKSEPVRAARPKDDRRGRRSDDREDGPPVVGLGDHVPQFLLRPVRIK